MKKQWNYVEKDGNPKEPGTYWVTLIYPEWKDNPELKGLIIDREPENGLAWTEECGSAAEEKVHAWMPMDNIEIADLPEGVESRNFESMEV